MTDEREPPSGTENTIAAPDTNPASAATVAAPSATQETLAENTLAPSSDVVRRAAGATPSSKPGSGLRSKAESQARSVGEEMQAATIQRFGRVDRAIVYGTDRLRAWKLAPDRGLRRFLGHTARVRDLAWSADGRMLWSASHDGTARGVDIATGKATVLGIGGFTEPPLSVHPSGGGPPAPVNPKGLRSLQMSPDGRYLATAAEDGTIILYELTDPRRYVQLVGHEGRARRIVFSRDQRSAYSVGDHTLRAWDLATGKQRAVVDLRGSGWDVALIGDDRTVITQDEEEPLNQVLLWNADDLRPLPVEPLRTRLYQIQTADDRALLGTGDDVQVLMPTGEITARVVFPGPSAATIAKGKVAVAGYAGFVALFTWPELKDIRSWQSGSFLAGVRFRPDGAILATIGERRVRLWDPVGGRLLAEREMPVLLTQIAWSSDGTRLAFAGASGTVWVWDLTQMDASKLGAYIKCAVPWQLADSTIVAATFDPAACTVLAQ